MRILLILIFSSFFLAIHCRKHKPAPDNPYGLPNATQKGANMIACRINGNNWELQKLSSRYLSTSFRRSNSRDTLSFWAIGKPDSIIYTMVISINQKIQQDVTYRFNDTTQAVAIVYRPYAACSTDSLFDDSSWARAVDGSINISKFSGTYTIPACCSSGYYDANSIIAGTFNFTIAIPGCDSIKVTDGRFDINYSNY